MRRQPVLAAHRLWADVDRRRDTGRADGLAQRNAHLHRQRGDYYEITDDLPRYPGSRG
jgi:hypothetical protein